jgi:hypothetical protein
MNVVKTLIQCGHVQLYNINLINLMVKLKGTPVRDLIAPSP